MGKIPAASRHENAPNTCTNFIHMMLALNHTKITKWQILSI
jgi:hypothetical protein